MGRPLVHAVIPLIDNLTAMLQTAAKNRNLDVTVRAGALAGIKVLNKYYAKTDNTVIYRLAMSAFLCLYLRFVY